MGEDVEQELDSEYNTLLKVRCSRTTQYVERRR